MAPYDKDELPWVFLAGNLSEGFTARGPYANADDCFDDNPGCGWAFELQPPTLKKET